MPRDSVAIEGWRKSLDEVATFVITRKSFTTASISYRAWMPYRFARNRWRLQAR